MICTKAAHPWKMLPITPGSSKGLGLTPCAFQRGYSGFPEASPPPLDPPGTFIPFAERIKKAVSLPVIAVGKINLSLGNELLEQKKADFIAMGRPFLADPELAAKAYAGHQDRIRECLYCNQCTQILKSDEKPNGKGIRCPVNASLLREGE
jgi:2,4-dienoyl-CoA reductase-like NADH-dependent reductase (Old Yellow Enzyme family)